MAVHNGTISASFIVQILAFLVPAFAEGMASCEGVRTLQEWKARLSWLSINAGY